MNIIALIIAGIILIGGGYYFGTEHHGAPTAPSAVATTTDDMSGMDMATSSMATSTNSGTSVGVSANVSVTPVNDDTATSDIVGTWQSESDAKFTQRFQAGNIVGWFYAGDDSATMGGNWSIFTSANAPAGIGFTPVAGDVYLKIKWETSANYYRISKISATSLELVDLSGAGGATDYTKVGE